jgi:hypothetical protein
MINKEDNMDKEALSTYLMVGPTPCVVGPPGPSDRANG